MSFGDAFYSTFATRLTSRFSTTSYTYRDLARIASYFWSKLNDYYKQQWKLGAAQRNKKNKLTGKRKLRGFWFFAVTLEEYMVNYETAIFYEIWHNFRPEHRLTWLVPAESIIEQELQKVWGENKGEDDSDDDCSDCSTWAMASQDGQCYCACGNMQV